MSMVDELMKLKLLFSKFYSVRKLGDFDDTSIIFL